MRVAFASVCLLALSACADLAAEKVSRLSVADLAAGLCQGSSSPRCRFLNSPVQLTPEATRLPGRPLTFFPLADRLEFVDGQNRRWIARRGILTDGASIPKVFVPIIGQPDSPEFRNAAAMHDAYCGIGNEKNPEYQSLPWEVVHRMFYDALRVGGTPEGKAQIMFAAVYLAGPRWDEEIRLNDGASDAALQDAMRQTINFIEQTQPTMAELIDFLRTLERTIWTGLGTVGTNVDAYLPQQTPVPETPGPGEGETGNEPETTPTDEVPGNEDFTSPGDEFTDTGQTAGDGTDEF